MRPSPSRRPVSSLPSFAAPAASPASAASVTSPAFVAFAASPALARYGRALAAGLVALSLGPAAAAAPKPAAAPAEATTASVTRGRGCVREGPGQACRDASVDLTTAPQGAFVAGAEGATLRLNDGSLLELDPEAEVRFLATQSVQVPARVKAPVVQLLLGRARCTVAAAPPPKAVMVRGPSASVAVVSGGTASFRAWPDKLAVGVRSGKAITSAGENDWVELKPGRARMLARAGKSVVHAVLAAPTASADPSFAIASTPPSPPPTVRWQAVPGAEGYEVALRPLGTTRPTWTRRATPGTLSMPLTDVAPGAYEALVRALDAEDLDEAWSKPTPVNFVALELPPGAALVGENSVQLPDGQKLGMRHVQGLESALNDSTTFAPAAGDARLLTDRPQRVRLRRPGSTREIAITLEPRSFRVNVEMGPKRARWPGDSVSIVVRAVDREGNPLPSAMKLTPKVYLNTDPINVAWTQEGSTMRAVVAPRPNGLPNVVRVEVLDQYGYVLGRNFLEIADKNTPSRW